jgi:mRNA interferase YafQ
LLEISYKNSFKKDLKLAKKRNKDLAKLKEVIRLLAENKPLAQKYQDHILIGKYKNRRECHINPDWLLIYKKENDVLIIERTGTHSDLFE